MTVFENVAFALKMRKLNFVNLTIYIFFQHEKILLDRYISILVYQLVIAIVHI